MGPPPPLPGVLPSGSPLSAEEKAVKGGLPWRLAAIGASDKWAGKDWEQSPPPLEEYATDMQDRAWHLKVGILTKYAQGSTPERIIQSSQILWDNGFSR